MQFNKPLLLIIICFIASEQLIAGNENLPAGAASAGMANASATLTDVWSSYNNQAGCAYVNSVTAGIYNEIRFGLKENSFNAFGLVIPAKKIGNFSLSASYYGFKLYNEQKIGLGYSRKFGNNIAASLQADYMATNIDDEFYGNSSEFTVEAGFRAMLTPQLALGFHLFNPLRSKISDYDDERTPTTMKLGLSYEFNKKIILAAEAEKSSERDNIFKLGINYHIIEPLYIRTGFSTNNTTGYFGFGLEFKGLQLDFAASWHQVLGFTPHTSLSFKF